jgi:AsmA protein
MAMNKAVKWFLVVAGSLVALIVVAVIVLPMVIDVEKYKPQIEQQVAKATGRSFKLGGDLKPSIFPWIGFHLSDLHLGNPSGFKEKDFISVASFEVRVKLLPLLSRSIEVKRFVINKPVIVLEKSKAGKGSWEGLGSTTEEPAKEKSAPSPSGKLPIEGLLVGEFAITEGMVVWLDQASGVRKEVKNIDLVLTDVSFDQAIGVAFSALVDQKPVKLDGIIGPIGAQPGKSPIPLEMAAKLLDELDVTLSGRVDPSVAPAKFDIAISVAEFSPRKILEQLGQKLPIETADANVLNAVVVSLSLKGNAENIAVSDGRLRLDDSQGTFTAQASEFDKPNLKADLNLDRIDLDRYLPPPSPDKTGKTSVKKPSTEPVKKKTDYTPLRRLVMDARFKAGELKAKHARMQNLEIRVSARNGIIQLDPLKLDLYQGSLAGNGTLNVQKDKPTTALKLSMNGIQAGPLIRDVIEKELIEGAMAAEIDLDFKGDAPDSVRQTLNGKGDLQFNDGAIVGIDLASMVRNVQTAFGLAQQPTEKPRTDFAELLLPFTVTSGLFKTNATRLVSPLLRVLVAGKADLAKETLDFRVEPKFVATIQGQGDTSQRKGIQVPVMVAGTFTSPTFTPDLKAILGQQLGQPLPDKEALEKMVPSKDEANKILQQGVKGLLKGFDN